MNRYELQVVGHIDARLARALGAELGGRTPDGLSVLVFSSIDAAATYGLLARLRDLGLELVSMAPVAPDDAGAADPGAPDGGPAMRKGRERS